MVDEKKILPFKYPMISCFPFHSNTLSILSNYEDSYPWIMNNFIQVVCWHNKYIDYYDFYYRNCPLIRYERISKNVIHHGWSSIVDFAIDSINSGSYIYLVVNTAEIAAY